MEKFKEWIINFMQGRYGFDELGRSMSVWVIVLIIASIVLSLVSALFYNLIKITSVAVVMSVLSNLANWIGIILLVIMCVRMLSRNHEKRRSENQRYLSKRSGKQTAKAQRKDKDHKYLDCPFCGQKMRVPVGKGKIAVKCPKCGEKTISNT